MISLNLISKMRDTGLEDFRDFKIAEEGVVPMIWIGISLIHFDKIVKDLTHLKLE